MLRVVSFFPVEYFIFIFGLMYFSIYSNTDQPLNSSSLDSIVYSAHITLRMHRTQTFEFDHRVQGRIRIRLFYRFGFRFGYFKLSDKRRDCRVG